MKKVLVIAAVLMLLAGSSFAGTTVTAEGASLTASAPASLLICKASKGVKLGVQFDNTNGTGYAVDSYHTSGTKMYGTAYDSTALFFKDVGVNYTGFAAPTSSVGTEAFTGWTQM